MFFFWNRYSLGVDDPAENLRNDMASLIAKKVGRSIGQQAVGSEVLEVHVAAEHKLALWRIEKHINLLATGEVIDSKQLMTLAMIRGIEALTKDCERSIKMSREVNGMFVGEFDSVD
jgi:hypothetical protein